MKKYILKSKFYGKVVHDSRGQHLLNANTTQKELKDLYILGHTEKIDIIIIEDEKSEETTTDSSYIRTTSNRRKQTDKRKKD